jgi:tetratricopeptide (TPR) repeat protein
MRREFNGRFVKQVEPRTYVLGLLALSGALMTGCFGQAAQQNQKLLQQQQAELEQMQRDLAALQAQTGASGSPVYSTPAPSAATSAGLGACDTSLAHRAANRGAQEMKTGNLRKALSYYQDAAAACPKDPEYEFKLGQVYEAMGQRAFAREHYRRAEVLAVQSRPDLADRARKALAHLEPQQ